MFSRARYLKSLMQNGVDNDEGGSVQGDRNKDFQDE